MSTLFVSPAEVEELTGYKTRARQRHWLVEHGWKHEVDRRGFPKVLRAELERRMLGSPSKPKERELNIAALVA